MTLKKDYLFLFIHIYEEIYENRSVTKIYS